MTAVIYARYSSDNQREESIEGQIRECTEFAQRKEYTVIAHYIDRALSARTADRPGFQRMIKDSEKGIFDTVLVWKLDRFSRDRYDSAYYKHILKKNGVKVVSATESISEGPEGVILESMLEGMAEYYSLELKKKVERGHKENALKCKHNGGTTPYGYYIDYKDHVLAVDPNTSPIVQEIFTSFDNGKRIVDIARDLNDRGILCSYGKPFTKGRINAILQSRRYLGEYKYGDIVVPGGIPAIIDQELFDRVNRKLSYRKSTNASGRVDYMYYLSSKLFCGECGWRYIGETGTSHAHGPVYHYYKCGKAKLGKCAFTKGIPKEFIEKAILLVTMDVVLNDEVIDRIAEVILKNQNAEDPLLPVLRQQLTDCERKISNMSKAIEEGIITPTTRSRLEELESERDRVSIAISKLELQRPCFTKYEIVSWINKFRYNHIDDPEFQKCVIDSFLNSVFVFKDRFVFVYNYHSRTRTLKLSEVKEAFGKYINSINLSGLQSGFVFVKNAFGFVISRKRITSLLLEDYPPKQ